MAKKPQKTKKVAAKQKMAFEHVENTYEDTAKRLVDAVDEFNAAMREAYKRDDMHVFCGPEKDEFPMCLGYKICQVTHEKQTMRIKLAKKQEDLETAIQHWRFAARAGIA